MSASLLPEAQARSSVCVVGALFGCATALLCTTLISHCMPASSANLASLKQHTPLPIPSRRERAEKMLEEMRAQRAGAAARPAQKEDDGAAGGGSAGGADLQANSTSGSSSWASTSEYDSSADEEAEVDSEYERMEDLRLKMVFVVRHPVQPKMSAQEVAVLTATAGVQLVELQQQAKGSAASSLSEQTRQSASEPALPGTQSSFVPDSEDRQRWLHWYLWWNRIGCGKITLRCPDRVAMDAVLAAALEMRLPMVQLHRSQFSTLEGVTVQGCAAATMGGTRRW